MTFALLVGLKNNLTYSRHFYAQTRRLYPDIELVFVSYNSTDGTHQWLDSLRDERVIYHYENEERTLSDTYNTCIELATTEYVIFAHNDMVLTPGFIENLASVQSENRVTAYTTIEPPIFADDERPGKIVRDFGTDVDTFQREALFAFSLERQRTIKGNHLQKLEDRVSFFLCAARNVLLEIGGLDALYNPMFCEDDDLTLRLKLKGLEMAVSLDAICYHFVSKTSRFSEEYSQRTKQIEAQSNRNFIRKWGFRINSPVRKTYDIGLVLTHGNVALLREVEPWCSVVYTDIDATLYVQQEQASTRFDLTKRIKPLTAEKTHDILVSLNAEKMDAEKLARIETLHEAVYAKLNTPPSFLERLFSGGSRVFTWNSYHIRVANQTSYEHQLIYKH